MPHYKYSSDEIVQKGGSIYQSKVSSALVKEDKGKYVAIDIETEDYAVGDDQLTVGDSVREKHPGAAVYVTRVGNPGVTRLGRSLRAVAVRP